MSQPISSRAERAQAKPQVLRRPLWAFVLAAGAFFAAAGIFAAPPGLGVDYKGYCQHCHGAGKGDGPAAIVLPMRTPDWKASKPAYFQDIPKLKAKIQEMRADGLRSRGSFNHFTSRLSAADLNGLATYLKLFNQLAESVGPRNPSQIYAEACAFCHGFNGTGVGVLRGFRNPPLNFRSPKLQKYTKDQLVQRLKDSQKKIITLPGSLKHVPVAIDEEDLSKLAEYLKNI